MKGASEETSTVLVFICFDEVFQLQGKANGIKIKTIESNSMQIKYHIPRLRSLSNVQTYDWLHVFFPPHQGGSAHLRV